MEAPSNQKKPDPCCFVIFGATGDLAHRLVIPALYNLAATGLLPDKFCIVGIARKAMSNDALRDSLMKGLRKFATRPVDDAIAKHLLDCRRSERTGLVRFVAGTTRKAGGNAENRRQPPVLSGNTTRCVCADQPRARPRRPAEGRKRRVATARGRKAVRN